MLTSLIKIYYSGVDLKYLYNKGLKFIYESPKNASWKKKSDQNNSNRLGL